MDDLELIDVRRCPDCGDYFEESGPNGLVVHVMTEHPAGLLAQRIRTVLPPAETSLRSPS